MTVLDSSAGAERARAPVHLWIVGVVALLWSLTGAFDYLATQLKLDFYMSQFTEEQLDYFYGFPAWAVAGWAFGVWGGLAGAVGLLLRRSWAVWAFAVSLAGLARQLDLHARSVKRRRDHGRRGHGVSPWSSGRLRSSCCCTPERRRRAGFSSDDRSLRPPWDSSVRLLFSEA